MDADGVSESSSVKYDTRGGGNKPPPRQLTWVEYANEQCPYYMAMGVTYDQYWNGDYSALKDYKKAYEIKRELDNENFWLQGMYVYEAVETAIMRCINGKRNAKYPEEPYYLNTELSKKRKLAKQELDEMKSYDYMMTFMAQFNKRFNQKNNPEKG